MVIKCMLEDIMDTFSQKPLPPVMIITTHCAVHCGR